MEKKKPIEKEYLTRQFKNFKEEIVDKKTFDVDSELSMDSENPVQNKVITEALQNVDNAIEITFAEYKKLPEEEEKDKTYFITDLDVLSTGVVEITQEDYDLLPDTKLTDGIFYLITD